MYKAKKRGFRIRDIAALIIGAVLHGISSGILEMIFSTVQADFFMYKDDLLFLHSSITDYILPTGLAFVFIFLWMRFVSNDTGFPLLKGNKLNYIYLSLISLVITLTISFVDIFTYTRITDDGLYIRASILSSQEYMKWNSVDKIQIYYEGSSSRNKRYNIYYRYQIVLRDEKIIDMDWADDFKKWDKVLFVNDFLKNKGFFTEIAEMDDQVLDRMVRTYEEVYDEHTEEVIRAIFSY